MKTVALIAALPSEVAPLTRGWPSLAAGGEIQIRHGRLGEWDVVAAAGGMGARAVTRACEAIVAAASAGAPVDTLISIGYAGSLTCGLRAPDACAVREVIDAATGEHFPTEPLSGPSPGAIKPQRLVTVERVADPEEKRRLAEQHQATLVDMEAAGVARFARAHNLKFQCFKAVTDGPNDHLPDFNRFTSPEGQLRIGGFLAWAMVHPGFWGPLRRLGQNSHQASRELSNFVSRALSGSVQ